MSECEKMNCGYWYKGEDANFSCCHFDGWWTPPCEEDDYEEKDYD